MANGTDIFYSTTRKLRSQIIYSKKIACQFTPEQFARINAYADARGTTFAGAVRDLIFITGPFSP